MDGREGSGPGQRKSRAVRPQPTLWMVQMLDDISELPRVGVSLYTAMSVIGCRLPQEEVFVTRSLQLRHVL